MRLIVITFVSLLVILSCTNNNINSPLLEETPEVLNYNPDDPLANWLINTGFDEDLVVDKGDHFLVENDIIFNKSDVRDWLNQKSKQRRTSFIVSQSKVDDIVIDASELSGKGSWASNFNTAVTNWNTVNGSILKFTIDNNAVSPDVEIKTFSQSGGYLEEGSSVFPNSSNDPGYEIRLGYDPSLNSNYSSLDIANQRITLAMHELGHIVGLAHTDNTNFSHISGTLVSDPYSIMITWILPALQSNPSSYESLTSNDKEAVKILYPVPSSPPSAPSLSATHSGNNWIQLNWTTPSSDEPITGYILNRINTGYQGTISDGNNYYSTINTKKDYPYLQPDFNYFLSGSTGFACYSVKAQSSAGTSSSSNSVCFGVGGSGGGF